MKWIIRYLKGTSDVGLVYGKNIDRFVNGNVNGNVNDRSVNVIGYVDSDYARDLDKLRSLTGYAFTLCGSTVSWKATLQLIVALSTTEAEYVAATEAVKKAIWLRGLVGELGMQVKESTVYCDSQSAIHLTRNPMYHERTKHIDVRMHFIRDVVALGTVMVKKIPTADNPADMMTKLVATSKFRQCLNLIRVQRS